MSSGDNLERICKLMPKVELHAHLNGSISQEMLEKIAITIASNPLTHNRDNDNEIEDGPNPKSFQPCQHVNNVSSSHLVNDTRKFLDQEPLNLSECFQTFAKIHELITTPEILHWVTKQVIEEFHRDNVVYLELRTTPKIIHKIPSKDVYTDSVIRGIIDCEKQFGILVKLLISVDRKLSVEEAEENVQLAIDWRLKFPNIVVGIDLSGDPTKGSFPSLLPSLIKAREYGLLLSCHLPEVPNVEEARQMLEFHPDRVGHALYIHPQLAGKEELWNLLKKSRIPVEVCLTSNLFTKGIESLKHHHVQYLDQESMPFVVCTDDSGVFRTTLSKEYFLLASSVLCLTKAEENNRLQKICLSSPDHMFATIKEKTEIKAILTKWWDVEFPQLVIKSENQVRNSS